MDSLKVNPVSLTITKCYEFDCSGVTFYIVTLGLAGTWHDQHLVDFCEKQWGPSDAWQNWSLGVCCHNIYQQFKFIKHEDATLFLLTWG